MNRPTTKDPKEKIIYVPKRGEDRGKLWEKARGMWKNRKPDPIKEHEEIREEWGRDLP
jgi:hypothetical protein